MLSDLSEGVRQRPNRLDRLLAGMQLRVGNFGEWNGRRVDPFDRLLELALLVEPLPVQPPHLDRNLRELGEDRLERRRHLPGGLRALAFQNAFGRGLKLCHDPDTDPGRLRTEQNGNHTRDGKHDHREPRLQAQQRHDDGNDQQQDTGDGLAGRQAHHELCCEKPLASRPKRTAGRPVTVGITMATIWA